MKNLATFRVHLTQKGQDKFQAVADHYGISVSALGALLVLSFLSERDKPQTIDELTVKISPRELWEAFGG